MTAQQPADQPRVGTVLQPGSMGDRGMTSYTCQLGWHVVRDFLRLWSLDGSGSMFVRFNGRLRDRDATCVYQVAEEPSETDARRVWAYEDHGRSWVCLACGESIAAATSKRRVN